MTVDPGPDVGVDSAAGHAGPRTSASSAAPWQDAANYPIPIADSTAGYLDGLLYSFGGVSGFQKQRSAYCAPLAHIFEPVTT